MTYNPRVIFNGPAGTGKTLLAVESARRAQEKTLFMCFNRLLGNWLKETTEELKPTVTTNTLHGIMLSTAGIQPPENAERSFWEEDLPLCAVEKLLEQGKNEQLYDRLIIDEAQDILRPEYLDFLDLILKGGLFSGKWQMYGDFEKQSIYESSKEVMRILDERFSSVPRFSLRVNCRNTPRIADFVQLFGGLEPGYSRVRRPDNDINPEIKTYKGEKDQGKILLEVVKRLLIEGHKVEELIVLSNRSDDSCIISKLTDDEIQKFFSVRDGKARGRIRFGTVHSFKGLEAPVVILTDIDNVGTDISRTIFYIGATRAVSRLIVLIGETAQKELRELWSRS